MITRYYPEQDITVGELTKEEILFVCDKCQPYLDALKECLNKYLPEPESSSFGFYQAEGEFKVISHTFRIKANIQKEESV